MKLCKIVGETKGDINSKTMALLMCKTSFNKPYGYKLTNSRTSFCSLLHALSTVCNKVAVKFHI